MLSTLTELDPYTPFEHEAEHTHTFELLFGSNTRRWPAEAVLPLRNRSFPL